MKKAWIIQRVEKSQAADIRLVGWNEHTEESFGWHFGLRFLKDAGYRLDENVVFTPAAQQLLERADHFICGRQF